VTLTEYRGRLEILLDTGAPLNAGEIYSLREIVRQRRNGRRNLDTPHAAAHILERADEIVALLGAAASELRPRETQALDDLVAGRPPRAGPPPSFPVRMHRSGWPSR
jgi:hypothetical protein